jgi:hypothetical protein
MNQPPSSNPGPTPAPTGVAVPPPRRWTFWRALGLIFFIAAGVMVLLVLANGFENWRAARAWAKCRQQLEARGEKLDHAAFDPPEVPADQNFTATPLLARAVNSGGAGSPIHAFLNSSRQGYPAMGSWQKGTRTDLSKWAAYYRSGTNYPVPATSQGAAADVLAAFSRYDREIAELREASRRPQACFPRGGGEDPTTLAMNHLALAKGTVSALNIQSVALLAEGRADEALANLRVVWRFDEALRGKPLVIAMLVRIAVSESALAPIWEGLAGHRWNEAQLAAIDQTLARVDFLGDMAQMLRGERAFMNASFEQMTHLQTMPRQESESDQAMAVKGQPKSFFGRVLFPAWMIQRNQVVANQFMQDLIDGVASAAKQPDKPFGLSPELTNRWAQRFSQRSLDTTLSRPLWESISRTTGKAPRAQAGVNLARVAVALERCRLANGGFPDQLTALSPKFLARVPSDPFSGQALLYRKEASGGYLLYSVGSDRKDDGGKPESSGKGGDEVAHGDVVWRLP